MELLTTNNVWMMLCAALVFFMHLGFSFLEIGLTRQKNTINILFKNFFIITMGLITYCLIGFNLMYPGDFNIIGNGILGFAGPGLDAAVAADLAYNEGYTYWTDFLFQGMFAATAGTIISGAVAERIKINSFMLIILLYVTIVYPIVGSWQWGSGFLSTLTDEFGFYDFAGSTLVHSVGGWGALVIIYLLGARKGKFDSNGKPLAIPGSNIPLSAAGVLILWLGWFGFNPGSELAADQYVMSVAVNTMLAATAGALFSAVTIWLKAGKPDVAMVGNGALAGLVAITAPCGTVDPLPAALIGGIGGIIVVYSVYFFDKVKIDDPVGAVSVHGVCGIWGTLSIGLFAKYDDAFLGREDAGLFYGGGFDQLGMQAVMLLIIIAWVTITTAILFTVIKATIGLRVSAEEETEGLDVLEHGLAGYSGDSVSVGS